MLTVKPFKGQYRAKSKSASLLREGAGMIINGVEYRKFDDRYYKWFVEKYEIPDLERCRDYRKLAEAKASRVARNLSPREAQGVAS